MKPAAVFSSLQIFLTIATGLVSGAIVFGIITGIQPQQASKTTLWLLFISLTVVLSLSLGVIWHFIRKLIWLRRFHIPFLTSLRQATLLSIVITLSLFLNSLHLFSLWDSFPLLLAVILVEFFFQADKHSPASSNNEQR